MVKINVIVVLTVTNVKMHQKLLFLASQDPIKILNILVIDIHATLVNQDIIKINLEKVNVLVVLMATNVETLLFFLFLVIPVLFKVHNILVIELSAILVIQGIIKIK